MAKVPKRAVSRPIVAGAAALLLVVSAGLYGTARLRGNSGSGECPGAIATQARLAPLARGELAAFEVGPAPSARSPDLSFTGPDGGTKKVSDFGGRTILLNLWATWCEPCKVEMPALDRLQAELGGPDFEVVAVNIDTRDTAKPRTWLDANGIRHLAYYSDKEARIFQDLRRIGDASGMPTTLLIGPGGCRLGRISGPAEWAGPDGLALVRAALRR